MPTSEWVIREAFFAASGCVVARRISISISSLRTPIALAVRCWQKAVENTILSALCSNSFSHGLGHSRKLKVRSCKSANLIYRNAVALFSANMTPRGE